MRKSRYILPAVLAAALTFTLTACGGGNDAKGADAAAKATGKLVTEWDCAIFKDVDLRPVLASVSSLDGSNQGCLWEGTVGTAGDGDALTDDLHIRLEDGVPASYADYVAANGYEEAGNFTDEDIIAGPEGDIDRGVTVLKELKADGWSYGLQFSRQYDDEHQPLIAYFYDEGNGHGFSCTYAPAASERRFPDDEYFFSHPGKVGPWLDELQPKVLAVCSELMAAARS